MAGAIGVKGGANAAWNTEGFALFRSGQPCAVVSQKIATVERREASGPIAKARGTSQGADLYGAPSRRSAPSLM